MFRRRFPVKYSAGVQPAGGGHGIVEHENDVARAGRAEQTDGNQGTGQCGDDQEDNRDAEQQQEEVFQLRKRRRGALLARRNSMAAQRTMSRCRRLKKWMRTGRAMSGKAHRNAWERNCIYLAEALLRRR